MNVLGKPPELNANPCVACTDEQPVFRGRPLASTGSVPKAATDPEIDRSALALVENENAGLRRLIIQLIQENQQLRQQMSGLRNEHSVQSAVAS
jgi:molybdate-binding protein